MQGDVIGVGYRPRTGTVFFTRNGKKLEEVAHGLKSQNLFPAVGANGPCTVHVNFGQSGFVFIEANVKKWGLAPMTGSLAPPPPYGSEQGSILLESGRESANANSLRGGGAERDYLTDGRHGRTRSGNLRWNGNGPTSPGPQRSPTDISLAQLQHIPSQEDVGEGTSRSVTAGGHANYNPSYSVSGGNMQFGHAAAPNYEHLGTENMQPPPEYTSPVPSRSGSFDEGDDERQPLVRPRTTPPIPSYSDAVAEDRARERGVGRARSRS